MDHANGVGHPVSRPTMRYRPNAALVLALALASGLWQAPAHATEGRGTDSLTDSLEGAGPGDGVYGRFDGPLSLAIGGGIEAAPNSSAVRPAAAGTLRFYQSVGLLVGYTQAVMDEDPLERALAASFLLEPLFLVRWSADRQSGYAFWDLLLDSISASGGLLLAESRAGSFGDTVAFRAGLGAGLPLMARASGPWLRFGGQMDAGLEANVVGTLSVRLEWQWVLRSRPHD
jgi:hypothetical protein